ncbi:hypothetical protein BJ508DRAFT_315620 [Ascobolus immersus RN42]|uniref:Uncharacterized protein n=1 Tax=Ascobolus immersus RN42 TaxID=1160509 RepID=A0A3N4HA15_ASCIM|nr:hypothetical protein BJ508DRAFT_315620 [Ascobolus immersus RN42]
MQRNERVSPIQPVLLLPALVLRSSSLDRRTQECHVTSSSFSTKDLKEAGAVNGDEDGPVVRIVAGEKYTTSLPTPRLWQKNQGFVYVPLKHTAKSTWHVNNILFFQILDKSLIQPKGERARSPYTVKGMRLWHGYVNNKKRQVEKRHWYVEKKERSSAAKDEYEFPLIKQLAAFKGHIHVCH